MGASMSQRSDRFIFMPFYDLDLYVNSLLICWRLGPPFLEMKKNTCFLCGSHSKLSKEHKLKRVIVKNLLSFDQGKIFLESKEKGVREAQGPNSKLFCFDSRLCLNCNSSETQSADRAFDKFIKFIDENYSKFSDVEIISFYDGFLSNFSSFESSFHEYKDYLFNYFCKLFCGYISDYLGVRFIFFSKIALGLSNFSDYRGLFSPYIKIAKNKNPECLSFGSLMPVFCDHPQFPYISKIATCISFEKYTLFFVVEFNNSIDFLLRLSFPDVYSKIFEKYNSYVSDEDIAKYFHFI